MQNFELLCCVVNAGQGSRTLANARNHGIRGGTICIGKGVIKNKVLEFLDISDTRKEVVLMIGEKELALTALQAVSREMHFKKPNHGIGFAFGLENFIGTKHHDYYDNSEKAVRIAMYSAIFTVVEKGSADIVLDCAATAGARGGTVLNARGSGINEVSKLFAMTIEPEKEIVIIVTKSDAAKAICDAIRVGMKIDDPGRGIIFVLALDEAYGLY